MKNIVTMSLLLGGSLVYAQNLMQLELKKTVISATGFEEEVGNENRNVIVIREDDIQDKGYRNVREILEQVPGITFSDTGFGQEIDLRGQGKDAKTHVKIMIDSMVMNGLDNSHGLTPYDTLDIDGIERIEIIPGGGSVLYGSGTKGGVVNIITKQSLRDFYGNIVLKGGLYESSGDFSGNYGLILGGKIVDGFAAGVNIKGFNEKGYQEGERKEGYFVSLDTHSAISNSQQLRLKGSYYDANIIQANALTHQQLEENRQQSGTLTRTHNTRYDVLGDYQAQPSSYTLMNVLSYYRFNEMKYSDGIQKNSYFQDSATGLNMKIKWHYSINESSKGDVIIGYDLGYFSAETLSIIMGSKSAFMEPSKLSNSIFAVQKHNFNDFFTLLVGARYEFSSYQVVRERYRANHLAMSLNNNSNSHNYAYEITPIFHYSDDGKVYVKYERGFISPTPSQLVNSDPVRGFELNGLKSEVYDTVEIGMKDYVMDQFVSLSAFYTLSHDMIFQDAPSMTHVTYSNIDRTQHIGVEVNLEQEWDRLRLNESFSYIHASIQSGINKGKFIPLVPAYKATLGADYKIADSLSAFGDIAFYGDSKTTTFTQIDPYILTNIGLKGQYRQLKIDIGMKNLFDTQYNLYQSETAYRPAPGRNYYIEARYVF